MIMNFRGSGRFPDVRVDGGTDYRNTALAVTLANQAGHIRIVASGRA
jgi:hypothetical protein